MPWVRGGKREAGGGRRRQEEARGGKRRQEEAKRGKRKQEEAEVEIRRGRRLEEAGGRMSLTLKKVHLVVISLCSWII